jgi:serine/threonine protein kinase/Tol biopolymer transport system component
MLFAKGTRLGPYEILAPLGAGGMGEVYRARDGRLGRDVAVKVLPRDWAGDRDRMHRFEQEARAAGMLNHSNVLAIYDIGFHEGTPYVVAELLEGETLRARLEKGPLGQRKALDYALQITQGLSAAHQRGITHRDLKPGNLFLTQDGRVKILDFGLAKLGPGLEGTKAAGDATSASTVALETEPGIVLGTPGYMSPEQVRGQAVDHRSDIFSFGAVLYEMLTAERAFGGASRADAMSAILRDEPHEDPRIAPGIRKVIQRCLEKEPGDRFESARDLAFALDAISSAQESRATETQPTTEARGGRRPGLVIGAAAAAALLAAGYLLVVRKSGSAEAPEAPRSIARLTFDAGLQSEPTWSADGKLIAYSSNKQGKFDIWVQPVGEGNAVQVTHSPGHNWQPDFSPDGQQIVFRAERDGGLYVVPVLGGNERKIAAFGSHPRWSPDGSAILFDRAVESLNTVRKLYLERLDGTPPREILGDFLKEFPSTKPVYAAWHPDSRRISVWASHPQLGPGFWTMPADGRSAVRVEAAPEVQKRIRDAGLTLGRFAWAPAGDALYFEGVSRGVSNLWKIAVDAKSLRWTAGPERLTTGPGKDSDLALSHDGRKIAFTVRTERTQVWMLPFDPAAGQVQGGGRAETPGGLDSWAMALSLDGKRLAYVSLRPGRQELWQKTLADGIEKLLAADSFQPAYPVWSRDGKFLAFRRSEPQSPDGLWRRAEIVVVPEGGGEEEVVTSNGLTDGPKSWFSDNRRIVGITRRPDGKLAKVWIVSRDYGPHAEDHAQFLAADPGYNFYQPHLSPDERWILFMKVKADQSGLSTLEVMPAGGGEMTAITEGKYFDDKPAWAPDGRALYFLSSRGGFFNVWGIRFDPAKGKSVGEPFRVTTFEDPSRMATPPNQSSEMWVSSDRLALPITELSGNLWLLENLQQRD